MSRPIDADAFREKLVCVGRYFKGLEDSKPQTKLIGYIIDRLDEMPTTKVPPVIGCWIRKGKYMICQRCGVAQPHTDHCEPFPFCPVCGAKLTRETPEEWKMMNCCQLNIEDDEDAE